MGWGRRLTVSVLAFLLLVVIGIGGYAWFLSSKVDRNLARENLLGDARSQTETTTGKKLVDDAGTNYLLIGSDARPGETASRADVIQLVHVDADHDTFGSAALTTGPLTCSIAWRVAATSAAL